MKIEKKYYFYAGHRNKSAGEKCGRPHGHTYDVTCTFRFGTMENGITMLFSDIDKLVEPNFQITKQYPLKPLPRIWLFGCSTGLRMKQSYQ